MNKSDLISAIGSGDALPEQLKPIIQGIIEGRIKQFILIAEYEDGMMGDCFPILDDSASRYAMLGAIDVLKRDYMRAHIQSRIEYVEDDD